jgi:hypothetical protein
MAESAPKKIMVGSIIYKVGDLPTRTSESVGRPYMHGHLEAVTYNLEATKAEDVYTADAKELPWGQRRSLEVN